MKKLTILLVVVMLLSSLALVGCNDDNQERDEFVNYYDGGERFDLAVWQSGVTEDVFEINTDGDGTVVVGYKKLMGLGYPQVMAVTNGDLSVFTYFNLTIKASKVNCSVMIQAPLTYGDGVDDKVNVWDTTQMLGTDYITYSIAIAKGSRPQLNFIDGVWIYPEPGIASSSAFGELSIKEAYFSTMLPENSTVVNGASADSDTPVKLYGASNQWANEYTWTNYKPSTNNDGEVDINFQM